MSAKLSNEKNELIKNIAECQGYTDYNLEVISGATKGDNYLGEINTVKIEDKNNTEKSLHLILKSAPVGEVRSTNPIRKAYEREVFMYGTIFDEFKNLFNDLGVKPPFVETAKYYGSELFDGEECLLLEDLKKSNFSMWNRKLPMNEEHVALVFETYAKFHGSGLVLKHLKPEKYKEFSKNLINVFQDEKDPEAGGKAFARIVKKVFETGFKAVAGNAKATAALAKFAANVGTFFDKILKTRDKFSTILHGDCWCNNMMFKYEDPDDPTKPTTMRLLDWQLSIIGSPIQDLSYFFYASSSKEVLYKLKKFLKVYHNTLSKTLESAGLNLDDICTYEELEEKWKIYSLNGLFMSLVVMRIIVGDSEEAPDLGESAKSGKGLLESLTSGECSNSEEINQRISDIIEFMVDNDYL